MNKDNKKFIIETIFLKKALKKDLSLNEFLILMYFDNQGDYPVDVNRISKATGIDNKNILDALNSLVEKNIIELLSEKDESGKLVDKVSLDKFYDVESKKEIKTNNEFFELFQKNYGKVLSGMDFELINAWLASGFTEENILSALNEANNSGVTSLKYIDKILFEWNKRGFKTVKGKNATNKTYSDEVMEYNWLDE